MDLELLGKRAIVTGASRGLGLATARALSLEGVQVAMVARTEDALRAAATDTGIAFPADTSDDASVRAMVAAVLATFGGVDILVNAAALPGSTIPPTDIEGFADDILREQMETKVLGYLRTIRAVSPAMKRQGWGRIVNIAGLNARKSDSLVGSIRNIAVSALTKSLADELGPFGINVTAVHPGFTVTESTPAMLARQAARSGTTAEAVAEAIAADITIGRQVTSAEVADVVTFLCSPRSVAITGDAIAVGGGQRGHVSY